MVKKIQVNISNKTFFIILAVFTILAVSGIAIASLGTTPNPGHPISELQKCSDGETLKMVGGNWACAPNSGSSNTYDSGWFSVSSNNAYTKTHTLGVMPRSAAVWFSSNSDGSNARLMGYIALGSGSDWQGMSINNVGPTSYQVVTGHSYIVSWYTGGENIGLTSGYCRVVLSA